MIRLPALDLAADTEQALRTYQAEIDAVGDYAARVKAAHDRFASRNRIGNKTFDEVKAALTQLCSGARRCAYCEDSLADEIEHVRPKSLYPESVFSWPNYVYACGPCNRPKNNRFAVFPEGEHTHVEVSRKKDSPVTPPLTGEPAFLDPRAEDAMKWIILDLRETFRFVSIATKNTRPHARASYTIEVLGLNRDVLVEARKQAFKDYRAHLHHYVSAKLSGAAPAILGDIRTIIACRQHPTVWREMQRQHDKHPELERLFTAAPEAVSW